MTTYSIPDGLAAAYKGTGHVLVAIKDGALRDLLYLRDLLPDFDPALVEYAISDGRIAPAVARLSRLGDVSIGMASAWEVTEL